MALVRSVGLACILNLKSIMQTIKRSHTWQILKEQEIDIVAAGIRKTVISGSIETVQNGTI